jgi:hypothetical protein
MNKIFFISIIIVLLIKTETVFSSNKIFYVDNIIVNNGSSLDSKQFLDKAFQAGFEKLVKKILRNADSSKILDTELSEIKSLISNYQIIKDKDKFETTVNLSFSRKKINNFFYQKNILYADIQETDLVLFPVLIKNENFYLFSENYFFNNWNKKTNENKDKFINYFLPIENLDDIQFINRNKDNLESINVRNLLSNYDLKDYIFLIIKPSEKKMDIFLKGQISGNSVIKNFSILNETEKDSSYKNTIEELKIEISELWKNNNLIDVRTPSFLNVTLDINKKDDLLKLQEALNKIDLIDNYYVFELDKDQVKIKIKYLGKIDKIKSKLYENNIKVIINESKWKLKLI